MRCKCHAKINKNVKCTNNAKAKYLFLFCGVHKKQWKNTLGILFTLFTVGTGLITYYEFFYKDKPPFTTTIKIVDWQGNESKYIYESNLKIYILNKEYQSIINGKVEFNNINADYKNKPIKVTLEQNTDYELVKDTIVLKENPDYSEVKIKVKNLANAHGIVRDTNGNPIYNTKVYIATDTTLFDFTDGKGRYNISIPLDKQEWKQLIHTSKKGFEEGNLIRELKLGNSIDFELPPLK